jgi:SAM-dependent methyltransferase
MHRSSMYRMKWFVENYVSKIKKEKIKILDIGSYNVNGSYKQFFNDNKYEYTGLDIEAGSNVDIVLSNPYDWSSIDTDSYDVIITGQTFEHTEFFWITISEMTRVLKKDGLLCIIVPNKQREHRYPVDCYRFFTDGMVALARYVSLEVLHAHTNCAPNPNNPDWYGRKLADSMLVATKPYKGSTKIVDLNKYKCEPINQESIRGGLFPYGRKLIRPVRKFIRKKIQYWTN